MLAIIAGGLIGLTCGRFFTRRFQDSLIMSCGLATIFIGIGGAMSQMLRFENGSLQTAGSMMMIGSLTIGAFAGEALNLEDRLEGFGEWLKAKSGNSGDLSFVNAFVTATLTVCIGAMAIVGSIEDGIWGNHAILFSKSILDLIIIVIMTSSMGKGCIFSCIPVAVLQGSVTILARAVEPVMTQQALSNLSFVGSVLIFCIGINLCFGKRIKVANMLPALIVAVVWAFLPV